jgi:hypothetical protein
LLFSSAVALALGDIDRSALPPDLQASLAALPAGMAFSIKQLFLDLGGSTPIGCSYAGNSGAAPSWCTADVVARVLDEYWLNMPARARAIGYGVTAPSGPTPSLTPTAIGFVVSPHLDSNGAPSGKLAFNTLDYLVMTGSDPLPAAAAPFAWNWVEDVEDPPSGVIAVRRETFLQSLATVLDSITAPLCYQVSRTDDGTPTLSQSASPGQWRLPPPPADPGLDMVFTSHFGSDPTLEYTPGMPWIGARWQIKLGLGYQCSGDVSYTLPRTLNCWLYARMQADDGTPESDNSTAAFVDFMVQVPFTLQAGGTGRLTAQAGASTTTDNSTPLADDFPYKAQLTAMLDSQRTTIPAAVQGAADSLSVLLAGTGAFVFPAGQTFIAKDPILSDQFDLVVEVTYDQPHPAHDPS